MIAENTPSSTLSFHSFINSASQAPAPVANPTQFATINQVEAAALMSCTGTQIKVYLAIAGHANPQGTCWPSRERIAAIVGIQPVHVSRATAALERKGLLIKETLPNGKVVYGLPLHPIPRQTQPVPRAAPPRYHGRHPEQIIEQTNNRERASPSPEPATVEPTPVPLAVPKVKIESRTALPEDWTLPEAWQVEAQNLRPDLSPEAIQTSAKNFKDYHLSRGTQSANWKYEWTRWIRRERSPRPTNKPPAARTTSTPGTVIEVQSSAHRPYEPPATPSNEERLREYEAWAANMRKLGVNPAMIEAARPKISTGGPR